MPDADEPQTDTDRLEARIRRRQTLRLAVLVAIGVVFTVVAIDNRQSVAVSWVIGDASVPLIVALVASLLVGVVIGVLLGRRHHRD